LFDSSYTDPHGEDALAGNILFPWVDLCEIPVEELRIRHWLFSSTDIKGDILDFNAWPGDNEAGIIVHQNEVIAHNSDQGLTLLSDYSYLSKVFEYFGELRIIVGYTIKEIEDSHANDFSIEARKFKIFRYRYSFSFSTRSEY